MPERGDKRKGAVAIGKGNGFEIGVRSVSGVQTADPHGGDLDGCA